MAPKGKSLIVADYSQVEYRIMAHVCRDQTMIEGFLAGEDFHSLTAKVLGVSRSSAKSYNFALLYGMTAWAFAKKLGVPEAEGAITRNRYFARYPGLRAFHAHCMKWCEEVDEVRTLLNRRRPLKGYSGRKRFKIFVNTMIQGTAADILKIGMRNLHRRLRAESRFDDVRFVLQVHDEIAMECPNELVAEVKALVQEELENATTLLVPLIADIEVGPNWLEAKAA